MPFIWDDSKWLLVDEEDPYDRNRFVVARRLSIKPNKDPRNTLPIEGFSVDKIRRQIRKFGEIESIEILTENEPEAHVTFVSDHSAYLMLLQYEFNKEKKMDNPFEVEPVDSWEQPKENINAPSDHDMEVDEQTPEMFMLNEDCLLHLFKFLNLDSLVNMAEVCQMFNRLLHQHCFPRIQKYEVNVHDPTLTLAKVRRTLLCIGQHLTDLSYFATYEYNEDDDEQFETAISSKFLRIITQLVGQNIRRAHFMFDFSKDNRVSMIAPILKRLESLKIDDYSRSFTSKDIDFPALCPNLIEFKVNLDMSMIACCKPWPTLRSLSIKNNNELDAKTLISIVEQNPQITCLKFETFHHANRLLFLAITKYLPRLEKLKITNSFERSSFDVDFNVLGNLPSLCKINLTQIEIGQLEGFIDHLATFTNLRKIKLTCWNPEDLDTEDYGQSLINLAKKLPFLEELTLWDIPLNEVTLINIVCFARQLNVLDLWQCELDFSDELIAKLVDVLKSYRKESDGALRLYLDKGQLEKLDSTKNKEIGRYLQL